MGSSPVTSDYGSYVSGKRVCSITLIRTRVRLTFLRDVVAPDVVLAPIFKSLGQQCLIGLIPSHRSVALPKMQVSLRLDATANILRCD